MSRTRLTPLITLGVVSTISSGALGAADDFYTKQQIAVRFNETMNRCIASGCKNLEEVLSLFSDKAIFIDPNGAVWRGREAIAKQFATLKAAPDTSDKIEGIDIAGTAISLRMERRKVSHVQGTTVAQVNPHLQIIVLDGVRISQLVSVLPPNEK